MKIRRIAPWRVIGAATLVATVAAAQTPAGSGRPAATPGKGHEHGKPEGEHGGGPAGKPDKPEKLGKEKEKDAPEKGGPAAGDDKPGRGVGRHGMRGLLDELKSGKLKKEDVKARLDTLRESRGERQKEHREALKQRWGTALSAPSAREELEHHARRSARLERALVLVETEVGKDRDKLRERVQKLIEKENARHERAMERIKNQPSAPAPSASAAAPAAPAASAEKAGEK
jgi:hypothetical protein